MNYTFTISDFQEKSLSADTWKIVFTNADKITVICGDAVFNLGQDNAFVIPPDFIYKIIGDENSYHIFEFALDTDFPLHLYAKAVTLNYNDIHLFNKLLQYDLSVDLQNICAQKTIELLLLNIALTDSSISPIYNDSTYIFSEAIKIFKENIHTTISVDELANKLGISLSNIKRLFAKYTNFGVHDYFNLLKINEAKILLKDGHSVTETASLTGFANQAYFSAAFKRITGVSAKEFLSVRTRSKTIKKEEVKKELPSYLL